MRTMLQEYRARRIARGLLVLCILGWPLAAAAQTEVDRRVPATADGTVSIENVSGSVTVTGWDGNEVEVTGTLDPDVEKLAIETSGSRVVIRVELPRRSGRHSKSSAYLDVRVPRRSRLEVEVVSAEVTLDGVDGELDVESVSGSVEISGEPRAVDVETVSGSVSIRAAGAPISVESVSGRIDVTGAARSLDAESVSGKISVVGENLEDIDLECVSGEIELSASLAAGADVDVSCHSGSVDLRLDPATSARFEVSTFSGRIDNQLGPPAKKTSRYTPGQELDFVLGNGAARISIESFSGNVTLRSR